MRSTWASAASRYLADGAACVMDLDRLFLEHRQLMGRTAFLEGEVERLSKFVAQWQPMLEQVAGMMEPKEPQRPRKQEKPSP
jgi:hypothetical protein